MEHPSCHVSDNKLQFEFGEQVDMSPTRSHGGSHDQPMVDQQ
jgi:hypothetical protein